MPTLTYLGASFDCATAIKGDDYIHLLDESGVMIAAFDSIADFSGFTLTNGEYTAPTSPGQCYVAVIQDDGTITKGGHRCSDISNHTHDDRYYTESEVDTKLAGKAASSHNHSAGEITSGTLAVARGGTGLTASPSMLTNLGSTTAASVLAASPRPGVTGTLPIANGGTGATTAAAALTALGAAAASHNHSAANITSGTLAVARGGTNQTTLTPAVGTAGLRTIYAGTSDMTAGSSALTTGAIYFVYE